MNSVTNDRMSVICRKSRADGLAGMSGLAGRHGEPPLTSTPRNPAPPTPGPA